MRHRGRVLRAAVDPVVVVAADEFAELLIGLDALVGEHLADAPVRGFRKLDLPAGEPAVDRTPVLERLGQLERRGDAPELRAVVGRGLLGDELLLVDVFLDREQHLIGIHGLDEVVGDLRSHGLVHDVLLLALGDHDDGCRRAHLLDLGQGFESGHAGHHLVEDNQVVGPFGGHVYRVVSVVAGVHLVAFLREKQHVRFQQFHFVVHPEYFDHSAVVIGIRKNSDFTSQTQKPGGLLDRRRDFRRSDGHGVVHQRVARFRAGSPERSFRRRKRDISVFLRVLPDICYRIVSVESRARMKKNEKNDRLLAEIQIKCIFALRISG